MVNDNISEMQCLRALHFVFYNTGEIQDSSPEM